MTDVYDEDEDKEEESPAQEFQEVSLVPTLEEDEMETEVDTNDLETSVLKSPVTPEPNMLVNEDSMGFDNLQALNIVTPCVDSTQAFMSLLNKNLSPIKRKCHRADPEPEPLDSTQTYFNLTKHYKILSEERKKVLYGEPVNGGSASCKSAAKPLRRKLFDQEDELNVSNGEIKTIEDDDDDCKLESFEEEWKKVSILKPDRQEDNLKRDETIGKEATTTVEEVMVFTSEVTPNVADSFKTPANRVSKVSILTPQTEPDVSVPAMVKEETVCTVEDSASDEVLKNTEQPDVIMADPSHKKNGQESLKPNCNDVNSVPESRDHIQVSFDTKCQISPASDGKTTADQSTEFSQHVIANEVVVHNTESSDSESAKCEPSLNIRSSLTNEKDLLG